MLESLVTSLRSFQASLLSGGMVIFSLYVYAGEFLRSSIHPQQFISKLLHFSSEVPVIALFLVSLMIGSLYATALEGVVDALHRRYLKSGSQPRIRIFKRIKAATSPLSDYSLKRITRKAESFYDVHRAEAIDPSVTKIEFVQSVIRDIPWMEGKLVGTPLLTQYNAFRSTGEIQVCSSLLLPVTTSAMAVALGLGALAIVVATAIATLIALKLLDYGLYYYRRANSLVAHHVADGSVITPTMASFCGTHSEMGTPVATSEAKALDELDTGSDW